MKFVHTNNKIPIKKVHLYKQELRSLITVLNYEGVKVVNDNLQNGIVLSVNGIVLNVHSVSNIFTVYEIYLEKLYNLSTPGGDNVIADIGMNVGYASLFFASSEKVHHVYSYEPFPQTFKEAVDNIELNNGLKNKVTAFNYGVSNTSKSITVPQLETGSAVASTNEFFVDYLKLTSDNNITVQVKSIVEVLNEIKAKHPNQKIFLKIDCEGEEYGIMECLNDNGLVKDVEGFFIEWHIKGPDRIVEVLNDNNFTSLHLPRIGTNSGMIYAFK